MYVLSHKPEFFNSVLIGVQFLPDKDLGSLGTQDRVRGRTRRGTSTRVKREDWGTTPVEPKVEICYMCVCACERVNFPDQSP